MTGKLWVDDERDAPDGTWDVARSSADAVSACGSGDYRVVSLDYSLGGGDTAEAVVAYWARVQDWPGEVRLHSGNRDGRALLAAIISDSFPGGGGPEVVL